MSSVFLTSHSGVTLADITQQLKFVDVSRAEVLAWEKLSGVITRVDDFKLWGPARDAQSGVCVALAGRVALDRRSWREAERLPFEGGLACRAILYEWLNNAEGIAPWLNGAFCVLIFDPRKRQLHVFTDRMGMHPIYTADQPDIWLCSHPDVLADGLYGVGSPPELDIDTVVEFLATGSSVQPFTYYKAIKQLEPGSHYVWNLAAPDASPAHKVYWEPGYLSLTPRGSSEQHAELLAEAFDTSIKKRTYDFLGRTGVFLSGGADSRAMLFGAEIPQAVQCMTFFDESNPELETSRLLAAAAGAPHQAWQRDFDYYGRTAKEIVRISGGIWSFMDGHYLGFLDRVQSLNLGVVLTGCYADYMFKGLAFNRRHRKLLGRNLPLKDLSPFAYEFYQPHIQLSRRWQNRVTRRLAERFEGCRQGEQPDNPLAVEERRLRPLSREPDSSGRAILWRTMPFDWVFGDNDVLNVYGCLSVEDKLNGIVFEKAVARVVGDAGAGIINNNYRTFLGVTERRRKWQFLRGVALRKFQKIVSSKQQNNGLATTGSWPNWSYYIAKSSVIASLWANPSKEEIDFFVDVLDANPWEQSLAEWGQQPLFFMRILTVRLWVEQRGFIL